MYDNPKYDNKNKEKMMDNRFIGIELRSLNNAVRRYLDQSSASIFEGDRITCSNAWIIRHLAKAKKDVFQKDLEDQFGITRSTASKVLILLEKKGIIQRISVASDARLKKLVLTEKGLSIAEAMKENGSKMEAQLTKGFSEKELSDLLGYLERLKANLDPTQKEDDI